MNRVYEPRTIEFMLGHYRNGDIVHAGTYFGDFLPALSRRSSPGSKIWAFEPNEENYRCARITLELNNIRNVVLTNAALGKRKGSARLETTDETGRALGGASRILRGEEAVGTRTTIIDTVAIDDLIEEDRYVSIIQLDVEGHEREALDGGLATIERSRPTIILEKWPDSTLLESRWFTENILSMGYRRIDRVHRNEIYMCEQ